jgi:hypothetical protein
MKIINEWMLRLAQQIAGPIPMAAPMLSARNARRLSKPRRKA